MLLLLLLSAAPGVSARLANVNALLDREADPKAYELARADLTAALAAAPNDDAVQVTNARWLRRVGKLQEAQTAIEAVRKRSPNFVPALIEEGELALERDCDNGTALAHKVGAEALRLSPGEPRAALLLARIETLGMGPRLDLVMHADPLRHSSDLWVARQAELLLADVYEYGDHTFHARPLNDRCFQQWISEAPTHAQSFTSYATYLLHRGRYEEAQQQASKALELGVYLPARHVLALALRKQAETARPEIAKQLLTRAVENERSDEACDALSKLGGHPRACER